MPIRASIDTQATPDGDMPVCKQVALWAGADVLVTPNGAHFVNAPFMASGALLIEGVPWSMRGYLGQSHIMRFSGGVHHLRLHSERPPRQPSLHKYNDVQSETECAANQLCQHAFRDRADLHVPASTLRHLLSKALRLLPGCTDEKRWKNPLWST